MRHLLHKLKRGILNLGALAHRQETTDGLVLLLVFSAGWWMTAQQGGARAEALPVAMRLMLGAVAVHGAALLLRRDEGVRLSLLGLAGLPFVAWLGIDALWIAPDRGPALHGLAVAAMLATGWHLALHHSRRTWSHLMSLVLLAAPASILACGAFDHDDRHIRGLLGVLPNPAYAGHFISAMGSPGACAAVMLLCAMPPLAVTLNPELRPWKRCVAAYFAALLLLGLVGTHHAWAMAALATGLGLFAWRICQSPLARGSLVATTLLLGWTLAPAALTRVGILRQLPDDAAGVAWLARAGGEAFRNHPFAGGGAGSFPLSFEATRPPGWQTDPVTCGSLPLQLLCEHGLLGALLILLPAGWIAWQCLRRTLVTEQLSAEVVTASGGRRRAALRRSLAMGATSGMIGAAIVLCVDYPSSLPGVLLLLIATAAVTFRLSQHEETRVAPETAIPAIGLACLVVPVLVTPFVLSPIEGAALAAEAEAIVAQASPIGLATPSLLGADAQAALTAASNQLDRACRLNPLDGDTHAWHAQSLALLVRQTPQDEALLGRARKVAEESVKLAPRSPWAHVVLGSILLGSQEAGLRAQGLAHVRTAAELAPMNQSIAVRHAQALGQAGAPVAELRAAYERALLTNPTRDEVRDKLVLLKSSGAPETPSR